MDTVTNVLLLSVVCLVVFPWQPVLAQDGQPETPAQFFAFKSSTVQVPCVGEHGDTLMWSALRDDESLRSRIGSFSTPDDPDLRVMVISKVVPSDAGSFLCRGSNGVSITELVVVDPVSTPRGVKAQYKSGEVKVTWRRPLDNTDQVKGYKVYLSEVTGSGREAEAYTDPGQLSVRITGYFRPKDVWEIEVVGLYPQGAVELGEFGQGPKSIPVRIKVPAAGKLDSRRYMARNVRAFPWYNNTVLVTWEGQKDVQGLAYRVSYEGRSKRQKVSGDLVVTSPSDDGAGARKWSAVLEGLATRVKYRIHVNTVLGRGRLGDDSDVTEYRHDGFSSELSIRAVALTPNTALVTLSTVGPAKIDKLRVLFSDESAVTWSRLDRFSTFDPTTSYLVVPNLIPRGQYFFMARARVNKKARQTVTQLVMPPSDLGPPTNVSVTARTDNSVMIGWQPLKSDVTTTDVTGFIVTVMQEGDEGQVIPVQTQAVFDQTQALVTDLEDTQNYQITVLAFNLQGSGTPSQAVHFSITASDIDVTSPATSLSPPRFLHDVPTRLEINSGDEVKLNCIAVGDPNPEVTWFNKEGAALGRSAGQRNEILLKHVTEDMELTCQAINSQGTVRHVTSVKVTGDYKAPAGYDASQNSYEVKVKAVQLSPAEVAVKWEVNKGDLDMIRSFHISLVQMEHGRVLLQQSLQKNQRSMTFNLRPGQRYQVFLKTAREGHVLRNSINIDMTSHFPDGDPVLHLAVNEIRSDSAKVDFYTVGGASGDVTFYRLRVTDLTAQTSLYDQSSRKPALIGLQGLNPGRHFKVRVEAVLARGSMLVASLSFKTPTVEKYGEPLYASSQSETTPTLDTPTVKTPTVDTPTIAPPTVELDTPAPFQQDPRTPAATTSPHRRPEPNTAALRTLSTSTASTTTASTTTASTTAATPVPETAPTTTPTLATTLTSSVATVRTVTDIDNTTSGPDVSNQEGSHSLSLRVPVKTPYTLEIRWTVERGDLAAVTSFAFVIRNPRGRALLTESFNPDQRSVSMHTLRPATEYLISLQALGDTGVLAEAEVAATTRPTDATAGTPPDYSNPSIDLEVTEIRSSRARLEWALVNTAPDLIRKYRIKVFDESPAGFNLLTQEFTNYTQSLKLDQLNSERSFYVVIEALDKSGTLQMTCSLTFSTPSPGQYGTPVKGSPIEPKQELTTASTPEPASPTLTITITPMTQAKVRLTWQISGVRSDQLSVQSYTIRVKDKHAHGYSLLTEDFHKNSAYFDINGMQAGKQYYIELEAFGHGRVSLLSAGAVFVVPGRGKPWVNVTATSATSQPEPTPTRPDVTHISATETTTSASQAKGPTLKLRLTFIDSEKVRLDWTITPKDAHKNLSGFKVNLKEDGYAGKEVVQEELGVHWSITMPDLESNRKYVATVTALGQHGVPLVGVSASFRTPETRRRVTPDNTESHRLVDTTQGPDMTKETPEAGQGVTHGKQTAAEKLSIVRTEARGWGRVMLHWYPKVNAKATMVRYAEFESQGGIRRHSFQIKVVEAGMNSYTVEGLDQGKRYGFQVASIIPGSQYIRWSDMVLFTLDN